MKPIKEATVFVVEDNPDNCFILRRLLLTAPEAGGCGVKRCDAWTSGRAMLAALRSQPALTAELILLDIQIPHEDGYDVLKVIRAHPSLKDALVIARSMNVMPEEVDRAQAAGFDGFMSVIDASRFADLIRRCIAGEVISPETEATSSQGSRYAHYPRPAVPSTLLVPNDEPIRPGQRLREQLFALLPWLFWLGALAIALWSLSVLLF